MHFDRVKTLQREGKSRGAISKESSLNWRTVAKWAMLNELPERRIMSPKSTTPRKYEGYLAQRGLMTKQEIEKVVVLQA
jgi:hypothetical protein